MPAGRPRTFEPERHLPAITEIFWEHGFDGVSLDKVAAALGVSKPTLCKSFGDKEAVFAKSLDCYFEKHGAPALQALKQAPSLRAGIEAWLNKTIERILDPEEPCGCFLSDAAMSGKFTHGPVAARLAELQARNIAILTAKIEEAKRGGELAADLNTPSLVHYLAAQQMALSALSRTDADRQSLEDFVRFALDGVFSARPNAVQA